MTIKEIRKRLQIAKAEGKVINYHITQNDELHIYGIMPNTNQERWFFVGRITDFNILEALDYFL
jgi:hypothetical protein